MGCCKPRTHSPPPRTVVENANHIEVILQVPGASVHLVDGDEAVELAVGDASVLGIFEGAVLLATVMRVGPDLRWPLTKDEPVVKLDELHYLFSLPEKGGGFLNYGVSFAGPGGGLMSLNSFLKENTCFSSTSTSSSSSSAPRKGSPTSGVSYWGNLAPKLEGYNGVLADAIAQGTGKIVKGIFKCSDIYASQVQKGASEILLPAAGSSTAGSRNEFGSAANVKRGGINQTIRRVRQLSEMTERMSQSLLNGVVAVSGSVTTPVLNSKAGKALLGSVPGVALLASLDAVNKVLDVVESVEKRTLRATGQVAARVVSNRFGESAGEATGDVFATAGHCVGTAWNLFKIRKAVGAPSKSLASSLVTTAAKSGKRR